MGGLLSSILTDKNAEKTGVWVTYTDVVNDDGTYPEFCIKRVSFANSGYQAKIAKQLKILNAISEKGSDVDEKEFESLTNATQQLGIEYAKNFLVGWRNFKLSAKVDAKGKVIKENGVPVCDEYEYSEERAEALLSDSNPNASALLGWLTSQSSDVTNFLVDKRNKDLKR